MSAAPIWPWVWPAAGWALIALGVWPLLTGRLRSPRHRGRRCPRCGYDMAGLATLTCPECGFAARAESALKRRPSARRWRLAGLAMVLLGWAVSETGAFMRLGWVGATPDWALTFLAPARGPDGPRPFTRFAFPRAAAPTAAPSTSVADQLHAELWRRVSAEEIPLWMARYYLRRACDGIEPTLAASLRVPARWAWDVPMGMPWGMTHNDVDLYADPLQPTGPADTVEITVWTTADRRDRTTILTTRLPIDMRTGRAEFMQRVQTPEADDAVAAALNPRLVVSASTVQVHVDERSTDPRWTAVDFYVCCTVRLVADGHTLGEGWTISWRTPGAAYKVRWVPIKWSAGGFERARTHPDPVSVELIGEPGGATEHYLINGGKDLPHAWAGRATVKPVVERR
ncbi:MAG TPA: hypothetical protein VEB22_14810 [Phycisphaerales bacterium]|nr:hypothetical protein [Phycisphaerales bacterium]